MTGVVMVAALRRIWELRNRAAMLDPRLFRHRGMATGSASIFLMFLAMFGFFFIGVQYLQLLHGYDALKAASRPVADVGGLRGHLAGGRHAVDAPRPAGGRARAGLFIAAAGFALFLTVTPGSSFWLFLATSLVLGLGIALAMTPATNAIVASLPPEKQGIASAINDLSRELGSAFGVAIIGSAFNTGYRNRIDQHLGGLSGHGGRPRPPGPGHRLRRRGQAARSRPGPGRRTPTTPSSAACTPPCSSAGRPCCSAAVYVALRAPSRAEEVSRTSSTRASTFVAATASPSTPMASRSWMSSTEIDGGGVVGAVATP